MDVPMGSQDEAHRYIDGDRWGGGWRLGSGETLQDEPWGGGRSAGFCEALQDELARTGGVRLASGGLHDRTDQDARSGRLAGTDGVRDLWVGGDGLVDRRQQRSIVADHGQA